MSQAPAMPWRFGLAALVLRALWFRRLSVVLTLVTLALSVALFLSVTRLQSAAKTSFLQTVSGLDLIVAPRDSGLNVLLYSVFALGAPSAALPDEALELLSSDPDVAWMAPVAMGDSHRGYQVLASTPALLDHLRVGADQRLSLSAGRAFAEGAEGEVVLGAEVARALGYRLGQELVLSHGLGLALTQAAEHDAHPFRVVGILAATGSPFDRRLYVPLTGMAQLHQGRFASQDISAGQSDGVSAGDAQDNQDAQDDHDDHTEAEQAVNFAFVGLKSPALALRARARLQDHMQGVTAVLPGLSLAQLWSLLGQVELVLRLIAGLVLAVALLGLVAMLVATLSERRREMAIFRALGARPWQIAGLLLVEAGTIAVFGLLLGVAVTQLASTAVAGLVTARSGLVLAVAWPKTGEALALLSILVAALLAALIPAVQLYRQTLADGLSPGGSA